MGSFLDRRGGGSSRFGLLGRQDEGALKILWEASLTPMTAAFAARNRRRRRLPHGLRCRRLQMAVKFDECPDYNDRESRLPPAIPASAPHSRYGRYGWHTKTERHRPERPTPLLEASEAYVARVRPTPRQTQPVDLLDACAPRPRGGASTARIASAAMRQVSPNLDKEPSV
jgi:hypothetical protein